MSVTLAGRVLSSGFTITLTLPSGKTDDTNEGWLLVSGYQRHTLPPLCYTVPGPTGSHRHCSLRKHTPSDGQRQVRNNMGQINSMIRLGDDSSWDGRLKKIPFLIPTSCKPCKADKTSLLLLCICKIKPTVTVNGCWVDSRGGGVGVLLGCGLLLHKTGKERPLWNVRVRQG